MGNYLGLLGLQNAIISSFESSRKVQVFTGNEGANQLCLTSLCGQLSQQHTLGSKDCALVVLPTSKEMGHWYDVLSANLCKLPRVRVHQFVPYSMWGNDRFINHSALIKSRLSALADLVEAENFCIFVTSLQAMAQRTISADVFKQQKLIFELEEEYELE